MKAIFHNPQKIIILTIIVFISLSYNSYSQETKDDYDLFGITYRSPDMVNIIHGHQSDKYIGLLYIGFFPAGDPPGNLSIQINTMYSLIQRPTFESYIGLGAGGYTLDDKVRPFFGIFYNIIYQRLYFESGITFSDRDNYNTVLFFQIGFVQKF